MAPRPEFGFSDSEQWPTPRLQERLAELHELATVPHGYGRRVELAREITHLFFELADRPDYQPEIEQS